MTRHVSVKHKYTSGYRNEVQMVEDPPRPATVADTY